MKLHFQVHILVFSNFVHVENLKCIGHKIFHDKLQKKKKKIQIVYSNMLLVVLLYVSAPFCPKKLETLIEDRPKIENFDSGINDGYQ